MLAYDYSGPFNKDLKLLHKRRMDISRLRSVMRLIIMEKPLPERCHPHPLRGKNWTGKWECHVQPDWLLVYQIDRTEQKVVFHRTGTHSDLFK